MNRGILRNCSVCGEMFLYPGGIPLCRRCHRKLDEVYAMAREFLRKADRGEKYDAIDLARILDVEPVYLQILVQEGRLQQEGVLVEDAEAEKKQILARMLDDEANRLARQRLSREESRKSEGRMFVAQRKNRG